MHLTRRVGVVALLVGVVVLVEAMAFRPAPSGSPAAQPRTVVSESPPSEASLPSPTPQWGGPLPNGEPGPGASPCVEVDPGDCGIVTDYNAGNVPFEPTRFR